MPAGQSTCAFSPSSPLPSCLYPLRFFSFPFLSRGDTKLASLEPLRPSGYTLLFQECFHAPRQAVGRPGLGPPCSPRHRGRPIFPRPVRALAPTSSARRPRRTAGAARLVPGCVLFCCCWWFLAGRECLDQRGDAEVSTSCFVFSAF